MQNAFHAHPCHPERSGSHRTIRHSPRGRREVLRYAQDDRIEDLSLQIPVQMEVVGIAPTEVLDETDARLVPQLSL
jgi:hypothetical protein